MHNYTIYDDKIGTAIKAYNYFPRKINPFLNLIKLFIFIYIETCAPKSNTMLNEITTTTESKGARRTKFHPGQD